jgi:hypothetical protein
VLRTQTHSPCLQQVAGRQLQLLSGCSSVPGYMVNPAGEEGSPHCCQSPREERGKHQQLQRHAHGAHGFRCASKSPIHPAQSQADGVRCWVAGRL